MKRTILNILILILSLNVNAQIMDDMQIDESKVSPWILKKITDYEGIYFFGISEGESQYTIAISGDIVCVQISDYEWVKLDNGHSDWRPRYRNLTNCRIEGNKFYSDEENGEFVLYTDNGKITKGLKIYDPKEYEIGTKTEKEFTRFINGKYSRTKFEIIPDSELRKISKDELKIMRNEIFARYGYIFIPNGMMDTYFRKTDWYFALFEDVNNWITEIEHENIKNIKRIEEE